ncbi:little elongation complex subunit 1 [Lacerta agilis]|uniref:little elongation complex subunit 1 n=1 Tax=Lacerta agilis TaxID=80427 RepID=UPI001419FF01|nr:little elongation complex subunit 1 [Lacerta agilis]
MMPGETPPAAAAAGIAAEAATACANCGALQQNLNEYVAALIALKQKIIDTDHLLTEYQQKCNELQFAVRENDTLRHQVEQMLQKILPLEKCQEELGSVKAELEEKKSSLKIYQETHLEYVRVKEEMNKSDTMKKKLETKVKKLEEAAAKHIQEFKQLKAEKKVLEKELKKAQGKTDGFPNAKQKKVLKNAETQSERASPVADLDKEKIKLLLQELWMCIDSSTGKSQINKNDYILATDFHGHSRARGKTKTPRNPQQFTKPREERPSGWPSPETCTTHVSLAPLQTKLDDRLAGHGSPVESEAMETTGPYNGGGTFYEDRSLEVISETDSGAGNVDVFSKEQDELGENLQDILKWVRPLPPLLSPIQFSPAATPDALFGNLTDSSDEDEMNQDVQMLENILEKSEPKAEISDENHSAESRSKCISFSANSTNGNSQESPERLSKLTEEESALCHDPVTETSVYLSERDAISKSEKHLQENSDLLEAHTATEPAVHGTENINKNLDNMMKAKDKLMMPALLSPSANLQGQEKTAESMPTKEEVGSSIEHMHEEPSNFLKEGKDKLIGTVEGDWLQTPKGGNRQQTKGSILATENVLVAPENFQDVSGDVQGGMGNGPSDVQSKFNFEKAKCIGEEHTELVTTYKQNATEGLCSASSDGALMEESMNFVNHNFLSEMECSRALLQQRGAEVTFTQEFEKESRVSDAAIISQCVGENHSSEEECDKQYELNGENKLGNADTLRPHSHITVASDGCNNSLYCTGEIIKSGKESSTLPSVPTRHGEDDQLKVENENVVGKITDSITEKPKSMDVKKECVELEQYIDQKDSIKSPQEEPDDQSSPVLAAQAFIVEGCSEGSLESKHTLFESENVTESASELGYVENADIKPECKPKVHSVSINFQHAEAVAEDLCLTSERLEKEDSEPLKITETGTAQFIIEEGSEKTSALGTLCDRNMEPTLIFKDLQYGINDAPSQEKAIWNAESNSSDKMKHAAEGTETNYKCSVTNGVELEQNTNGGPAQSGQDELEAENAVIETTSNVTVSNVEINYELFSRNGQSSVPGYITPSSPSRVKDADHRDHNSGEDLTCKEANVLDSEVDKNKSMDCCSFHEMEIEQAREQPTLRESQIMCCGELTEAQTPEPSSLNSVNTVDIFVVSESVPSDEKLLVPLDKKLGIPSRNCEVEHNWSEATAKETDAILSSGTRSEGVNELTVSESTIMVMKSSTLDPLRKVNCTKPQPRLAVSRADVGGEQELSHVTEEAPPEYTPAAVHDTGSHVAEVMEGIWEHSYATRWTCSNENASLKLESLTSIEKSEERQAGQDISAVASLMRQGLTRDRKPLSRKPPASDAEFNSDIVAPHSEYSGTSIETSEIQLDFFKGKANAEEERSVSPSGCSSSLMQNRITPVCVDGDASAPHNKETHIKDEGETLPAPTSRHSVPPASESSSSSSKPQKIVSEKVESPAALASHGNNGAGQALEPPDPRNVSAEAGLRPLQRIPSCKGRRKSRQALLTETIFANADTSTPTVCGSPKTLTKIRQEMGPPLPPLLPPLMPTPPRTVRPLSPVMSSSSQSSLPSPLDGMISPLRETPVPPLRSPPLDTPKCKSPATFTTPSPSGAPMRQRALSSPLQFCAATPKHALPVPGRLPPSAVGGTAPPVPQENSVKILDSMYPELSARARTLNILKGNIQLSRSSSLDGKNAPQPVHQISGFKAIASVSTAFVKTGSSFKPDPEQLSSNACYTGKRALVPVTVPKNAKRLRLDSKSPKSNFCKEEPSAGVADAGIQCPAEETINLSSEGATHLTGDADSQLLVAAKKTDDSDSNIVMVALEKVSKACFDLLPVIRSHVLVGNTSKLPAMRDEEKEAVYELGVAKKHLAETALQTILKKLKKQKMTLGHNHIQALCRVYVGICRQLGDLEKARLFCYSLLKEDFPKAAILTLFIANMWGEIFSSEGVISKAIQLVARQRARGEVLKCLRTYLNWEENAPADVGMMVSSLLLAIQLCPQMEFQLSEQFGEDLKEGTWEYVFAVDLLCSHQKWRWTHDHIISKELWPIMDKWIKNRNGNGNVSSPSDIIVATVLRLIGRLGQIGLKEGFFSAVENISSVIGVFLQHAKEKDVAWGVQLAAAYALCELGPSNPPKVLEAIQAWEAVNAKSLPPAVTSSIAEVRSLLKCAGRTEGCS